MTAKAEDALVRRVRRLETALLVTAGALVLAVVGAAWLLLGGAEAVLRVRQLVIEDAEGRPRIVLAAPVAKLAGRQRTDEAVGLLVLNESGVDRVFVGAPTLNPQSGGVVQQRVDPSAGIVFNDRNGNERGGFGVLDGDDRVVLGLDYPTGEGVVLFVSDSFSGLQINGNAAGAHPQRVFLGIDGAPDGTTYFNLDDARGRRRVQISAAADGPAAVELLDTEGAIVERLPARDAPTVQPD